MNKVPEDSSVDEEAKLQVELPGESANASQDEECATDDLTVTVNIQETEKKNVPIIEEEQETNLEINTGDYVLVKFLAKKQNFHYVGKVCGPGISRDTVEIEYFRRVCESGNDFFMFKTPDIPDLFVTDKDAIVKRLPLPTIVKGKVVFNKSEFGDLLVR